MNPQWSSGQQQNYQNYAQYPMGGPVQTRRNNQIVPQDRDGGLGRPSVRLLGTWHLSGRSFLSTNSSLVGR